MQFTTEFWIQIIIYALTFGAMYGTVRTKLQYLEKKMDKHNSVQERLIMAEQSVRSAHHRIDELREEK